MAGAPILQVPTVQPGGRGSRRCFGGQRRM